MPAPQGRPHLVYFSAGLVTLIEGLLSRATGLNPDHFVVSHLGDMLWAALIYFVIRGLKPKLPLQVSAILAVLFCLVIELQQIYQAEWLLHLRSNRLAALVLGHSYSFADLLCYASGISIALMLDGLYERKHC